MSRPYAEVIGDPIAQSKSPVIHNAWAAALGIDAHYDRAHVKSADLADYLALRRNDANWRGCNVTMPHKQAIIPLLDRLDDVAARIGAVNTVVREADGSLTGHNTDAPGFAEPLGQPGGRALVLGAGGAARAIVVALAEAGCDITLAARDIAKARLLRLQKKRESAGCDDTETEYEEEDEEESDDEEVIDGAGGDDNDEAGNDAMIDDTVHCKELSSLGCRHLSILVSDATSVSSMTLSCSKGKERLRGWPR